MDEEIMIGESVEETPAETALQEETPQENTAVDSAAEAAAMQAGESGAVNIGQSAERESGTMPDPRQQDIFRFARDFPDVEPGDIPPAVLEDWIAGRGSLSQLYAAGDRPRLLEENRSLRARIAELEQAERNRSSAADSRIGAGAVQPMSELDAAWYDGT